MAYLIAGLLAGVITFVTTPGVLWAARSFNLIDNPNDRKVHASPTPTMGGTAIFLGVLGAGIAIGAAVIYVLGAVDDLMNLPAPVKLAGQVFAAGILFLAGIKMQFVALPGGYYSIGDDVSVIITVLWLVVMMNAVNLVDGLDGLAAGIVAIAASAFFVYTYKLNQVTGYPSSAPLVCGLLVGSTLGFLRYNFHPAKIFMGDSGAQLLGLLLGAATVLGVGSVPPGFSTKGAAVFLAYFPLLIPLAVLALPLLDAILAILRRARKRREIWHADKEHIHHRLMQLGHGHRQAVIVMYVWSALAAGAGLAFTFLGPSQLIFALPVAVAALVLYTLFPMLTRVIQERLSP
jgi:UDP-GlcNAc:undecaprenyl-phosphate GlcNAc-1-phosphate transferase